MIHIGKIIEEELRSQERSVTWLAEKLYCDRTNVYKIFKKRSLDAELLLRVSHILHINLFLYYSDEYVRVEDAATEV
ncbi:MAG: XRE family transcriptional regulator [Bacteroides sp.]|nr:XRE family transcriptional regulator [Bacteroides sp.]